MAQFDRDGIHFSYPESWKLEFEPGDQGWTVTVQSPDTAFMTLTYDESMPDPEEMAQAAYEGLRELYPGLDVEDCVTNVADQPAVGHDIQFFSLDLVNTCWTRSFYGPGGTILVVCTLEDHETEKNEPILKAICASLRVDEE